MIKKLGKLTSVLYVIITDVIKARCRVTSEDMAVKFSSEEQRISIKFDSYRKKKFTMPCRKFVAIVPFPIHKLPDGLPNLTVVGTKTVRKEVGKFSTWRIFCRTKRISRKWLTRYTWGTCPGTGFKPPYYSFSLECERCQSVSTTSFDVRPRATSFSCHHQLSFSLWNRRK